MPTNCFIRLTYWHLTKTKKSTLMLAGFSSGMGGWHCQWLVERQRENWTPATKRDGEGMRQEMLALESLHGHFFVDAKNFSGPLSAFVPEFFLSEGLTNLML